MSWKCSKSNLLLEGLEFLLTNWCLQSSQRTPTEPLTMKMKGQQPWQELGKFEEKAAGSDDFNSHRGVSFIKSKGTSLFSFCMPIESACKKGGAIVENRISVTHSNHATWITNTEYEETGTNEPNSRCSKLSWPITINILWQREGTQSNSICLVLWQHSLICALLPCAVRKALVNSLTASLQISSRPYLHPHTWRIQIRKLELTLIRRSYLKAQTVKSQDQRYTLQKHQRYGIIKDINIYNLWKRMANFHPTQRERGKIKRTMSQSYCTLWYIVSSRDFFLYQIST